MPARVTATAGQAYRLASCCCSWFVQPYSEVLPAQTHPTQYKDWVELGPTPISAYHMCSLLVGLHSLHNEFQTFATAKRCSWHC